MNWENFGQNLLIWAAQVGLKVPGAGTVCLCEGREAVAAASTTTR